MGRCRGHTHDSNTEVAGVVAAVTVERVTKTHDERTHEMSAVTTLQPDTTTLTDVISHAVDTGRPVRLCVGAFQVLGHITAISRQADNHDLQLTTVNGTAAPCDVLDTLFNDDDPADTVLLLHSLPAQLTPNAPTDLTSRHWLHDLADGHLNGVPADVAAIVWLDANHNRNDDTILDKFDTVQPTS